MRFSHFTSLGVLWRSAAAVLLLLFVLGFSGSFVWAQEAPAGPSATETKRNELEDRLNQIKQQINALQNQIATTKKQQASLKNEISIYDNQIRSVDLQIQANQTQIEDTNLQISELQTQIERRQQEIEDNKQVLATLVQQLYQLDSASFLRLTLGSDNFSELLNQVQYTQSLQSQVYALVKKIKEVKERLQGQQNDLKTKLVTLEELREQLNESEDAAAAQRQARQGLLDRTRGVERNYQNLLSQSRNEESKIQDEINRLEEAAQAKGGKNIIPNSGVLAWPMEGKLTQGYGNTGFRSLGYSFHNGIDIAAPAGKPIYAAASGTVNGTGNNDDVAYGNWVTIKHTISTKNGDQQIVTLYAHLRSMKVKNGQEVAQGDLIGYQGNTGNTTRLLYGPERGYHLHFTVFDASGFKIVPGTYSKTYGPYSIPTGFTYNPLNFLAK